VAKPIAHVLIGKDVIVGELYVVFLKNFEHGLSEPTLWFFRSPLNEDDDC
jgi:hypothetical protein